MKATIALYAFCLMLIAGCRKDNKNGQSMPSNELNSKINNWLTTQQYPKTPERNQKIDLLRQYLDYDHISFEDLNSGERFMIIPVKPGFKTVNNKNNNPLNSLVLTLDKTDKIREGKIIQFVPESGIAPDRLPQNTIHKIFNSKPVTFNGSFTALAVWDQYMFRLDYKEGTPTALKTMEPQGGWVNFNNSRTSGCIDWYLVTTLTVNGIVVSQTYEYVGTTCGGCTPQDPNAESLGCEGNGDGEAGFPPPPMPEPVSKQVQWTVKADATLGWHVDSYEFLQGAKPAAPLVPYFTAISHQNDAIFNSTQPGNPAYTTWQRLAITQGVTPGGGAASSTISGKTTNSAEGDTPVSNAKGWTAVTEFP